MKMSKKKHSFHNKHIYIYKLQTFWSFMKFYFVHIVKACFVFKKHHAYAYICLYMQKNNRKLNFRKNHWASLFSHRRLKTLKCSIPLTQMSECPKSKVTPLHKTSFFKVQLCPFNHFSCAKPCNFVCVIPETQSHLIFAMLLLLGPTRVFYLITLHKKNDKRDTVEL